MDWNENATFGDFETHNAGSIDAETMIDALVTLEAEFFPTSVNFYSWTIFTRTAYPAPWNPRVQKNISIPGTVATPGWFKAAQASWSLKTEEFNELKIVHLDVATLNAWDKITSATASGDQVAFLDALRDPDNAWCGRDKGKPEFFQQISFTLNEKLRREYRMN